MKIILKCTYPTVKSKKPVTYQPNEVVDLNDVEAQRLIDLGAAEPADRFTHKAAAAVQSNTEPADDKTETDDEAGSGENGTESDETS